MEVGFPSLTLLFCLCAQVEGKFVSFPRKAILQEELRTVPYRSLPGHRRKHRPELESSC